MDKLRAIFQDYQEAKLLSKQTTFEQFLSSDDSIKELLWKQGIENKVISSKTDLDLFKSAWSEAAIPEVKKKDEGMALPSEDGSLASSETDVISKEDLLQQTVTPSDRMEPKPTQTQVDYELGFNVAPDERIFEEQVVSEAPTQRDEFAGTIISQQPPKAFSEPVVQDGVSVSEQVKYDPFIESVNKVVNKELVSTPFFNKLPLVSMFTRPAATEENVIPQMQYYFGGYGFEFERADVFGDGMTVKAKNGKQTYVNLDQAFGGEKTAEDLKKFLIENREVKEYAASDRKIYDEQQIKDAVSALNEQAKEWNNATVELGKLKAMNEQLSQELLGISQYDIDTNPEIKQKVDMYNRNIAAEKELLDVVMKKGEEFEGKGILLDRLAGEYYAMKAEQGGMIKGITAGILGRGPANIASGGVDYGVDIYTYLSKNASLTEDKYKEELIRIAKEEGYLPKDEDFSGLSKQQLIERLGGDTNDAKSFLKGLALAGKQMLGFDPIGREKEEEALGIPTNFDKVNAKVLDYARKGIKYYQDYGVEGLDYDKAVEGRTVNPFSEIAAKVDTEMGLIDASRQYGEILSENIGATKEWSDLTKEGFWGGALLGLAESIPAMVGGMDKVGSAQRIAQMFLMTSSYVEDEMSKNPMFDNISESEKLPIKIAIGTVGAVLENYGFRNIISKNSFVANLALRALKKVPKGSSVKTLSEVISQDIESSIARGGLTLFAAGASEFETGAAQELSSILIKDIYNETKDKKMFQTPESLRDVAVQSFYAGGQEMVGGKIMGTPGAIVSAVSGRGVQSLSDMDWRNFEMINEDPTMKEIYVSKLKAEIANPKSDKSLADAKAELESVNRIQGLLNSNKQYIGNLSPEQKKRAVQLLLQKQELENKLKNADSQLSSSDRNLLDRVNDELDDLSKASTRIEESMEAEEKTIQEYKGNLMDWIKSIGKSKDIGDVMEGGVEIEMDGTKVIMTESDGGVVLESIETQKGKKGKGKAEAAIKQITEKADNDGVSITLKVVPKDSTVDAKRLQNLYERNGFEMQEDGVTMVRNPKVQELTQEQKDIEAFFTEDTDEDVERASDNLSINRANQDQGTKSPNRANAISAAKFAAKAISKVAPNVRIVLHEAESEYSKYVKGEGRSSGEYNPETNVIHINLPKVRRSTVAHEVFHAILVEKVKGDDALAKKISDDMVRVVQRRLPKNHKLRIAVEAHAAKYQDNLQTEEQVAELIGLLSSVEGGYTQLDGDMKSVIKRFFLNLAKKLNIPLPKNWGSDQDVVDLINTLARKTRTGEEITEEDVKLLDVKDEVAKVDSKAKSRKQLTESESNEVSKYVEDKTIKGEKVPTFLKFKKDKDKKEFLSFEGEINQENVKETAPQSYNTTASKLSTYNNFGIDNKAMLIESIEGASKKQINKKLNENKIIIDKKILAAKKNINKIKANKKKSREEKKVEADQQKKIINTLREIRKIKDIVAQFEFVMSIEDKVLSDSLYNSMFYKLGPKLSKLNTKELLKKSDNIYSKAKEIVKSNLLSVYNSVSPSIRKISKLWYDGANLIAQDMSSKYGITTEQAAAIIATQSPQMPWFDNLHLADVIMDTLKNRSEELFTQEMFDYYVLKTKGYPKQVTYIPTLKTQVGKKLSELSNYDAGIFIRVDYDLNISRKAPIRIPTGTTVKDSQSGDSSFSGYDVIEKGVSVFRDGSMDNISNQLGRANKVRNFYVNIVNPSDRRAVTIDTHAMAIALFKPLASNDIEVNFGPASFAFYADAYRELAEELGIEARALQSITWEAARAIFPATKKSEAGYKDSISKIWDKFSTKQETLGQVQEQIYSQANDPNITEWSNYINELKNEKTRENVSGRIIRLEGTETSDRLGDVSKSDSGLPTSRRRPVSDDTTSKKITTATRQQKGIQEARENGEVIETDTELVFFKGMQPKIKNGKPFSVHTIDKGRFVALDKNIALDYKGNKPLKQ